MRGTIVVETQAEFDRWLISKPAQYAAAHPAPAPASLPTQQGASDTAKPASGTTTVTTTPGMK
jgi:cytochrome c oxidase subunit 2